MTKAREAYRAAVNLSKVHNFVAAFNSLKGCLMIAHPMGMYHDNFCDKELMENKIMFSQPLEKHQYIGHGESIIVNRSVFALLDCKL